MKRRAFLNLIGSAIIGTAIALRLPDTIAPLNHLLERPRISFAVLMDAYIKARASGDEPCLLLLSKATMKDSQDQVRQQVRYTLDGHPSFHDAPYFNFIDSTVTDYPDIPDDVIQVHTRNGAVKEYYFA